MNNLNAAELIKAGRAVPEPFQLSIVRSDGQIADIIVRKILRLLPARRIVAVAEESGRPILVKLFIGRSASRYGKREVRGVEAIAAAGVMTPAMRWQGDLESGGGKIIAFEYLDNAIDLSVALDDADCGPSPIMQPVISELAKLHEGGVVQNDIHPENFLISSQRVYMIDGGDVSGGANAALSEKRSLANLALFLAQFHSDHDGLIPELLAIYEQTRGWQPSEDRYRRLGQLVRTKRQDRKDDYIEKAFRECTRFSCITDFNRFTVVERKYDSPAMQALLSDMDTAIQNGTILKDGNTATVAKVEGPDGPLVIKRYNIKGFGHLLQRLFRKSRAWTSWANTFRLEFLGINTLKPVALVEERFGPFRRRAYFVTEFVDAFDASSLLHEKEREASVQSIASLLNRLFGAGVTHGDLKASNLLLTRDGPVIIDLDSMTEHRDHQSLVTAERKDRERFMRNWSGAPELELMFSDQLATSE